MMKAAAAIFGIFGVVAASGATTAPISLTSFSVQVDYAVGVGQFGFEWELQVSQFEEPWLINSEMVLSDPAETGYTHEGFFFFNSPFFFEQQVAPFYLDVPPNPPDDDQDGDGWPDFWELERAIEGVTTEGLFYNPLTEAPDEFTATWSREAGAAEGAVVLSFPGMQVEFTTGFRVLRYTGTLESSRAGEKITGTVRLENVNGEASDTMAGPLELTVGPNDVLTVASGEWEGADNLVYEYVQAVELERDGQVWTGALVFADGLLATADRDYQPWLLRINSPDANSNGVPDLIEAGEPPKAAELSIRVTEGGVELTVEGSAGVTYILESKEALSAAWAPLQELALTAPTQSFTLERSGSVRFFQLREK